MVVITNRVSEQASNQESKLKFKDCDGDGGKGASEVLRHRLLRSSASRRWLDWHGFSRGLVSRRVELLKDWRVGGLAGWRVDGLEG